MNELFPTRAATEQKASYPEVVTLCDTINTHFHPRGTDAERLRTDPPGRIEPAACAAGSTGAGPGHAAVRDQRSGARWTGSSGVGPSVEGRRCRREARLLLAVRRAERGPELLGGGRDGRRRS